MCNISAVRLGSVSISSMSFWLSFVLFWAIESSESMVSGIGGSRLTRLATL